MKKILLFICMILGICGCSCNKDEVIKIKKAEDPQIIESSPYLYPNYRLLTYHLNSTDDYDKKIENKDSFVLFIYRDGCFGCQKLSPGIKEYLDENEGATVYSMDITSIGINHTLYKDHNISGTPWILIINEGNLAVKEIMPTFTGTDDEIKISAKNWFYDLMTNNVSWED